MQEQKNSIEVNEKPQPFFVRFIEQESMDVQTDVKAGKADQTQKAPSDKDEW